jgi:hypothetical protein
MMAAAGRTSPGGVVWRSMWEDRSMKPRSSLRVALAFVFVLGTLAIASAPAAAETVLVQCNGKCEYYEVYDSDTFKQGALCRYETTNPYKLDRINVRPPQAHGLAKAPKKSKVGWAFIIQRQPNGGGAWVTLHKSALQIAKANDQIPAGQGTGFLFRTWNAPAHPEGFRYRVRIVIRWWNGAGTAIVGTARVEYDWYRAIKGNQTSIHNEYCLQAY